MKSPNFTELVTVDFRVKVWQKQSWYLETMASTVGISQKWQNLQKRIDQMIEYFPLEAML